MVEAEARAPMRVSMPYKLGPQPHIGCMSKPAKGVFVAEKFAKRKLTIPIYCKVSSTDDKGDLVAKNV